MASIYEEIVTLATPSQAWQAVRDIGALHTRLVPGFVTHTQLEGSTRIVTFGNGMVVREPIITVDDTHRRLVWGAESERLTHYNASVQVFESGTGSRIVWIADLLPDNAASFIQSMMQSGMAAMKRALDETNHDSNSKD
ncbi:MAG TPA: SRPBCC family protein [Polyangiaceae bacterium]|nr:SRPBCC family protein [Polyangiaceae bacterium]